ncbi:MAG: hypothetical protein EOP82_04885 [Variovorax sp.]|nr:MAG: hypothetical protein EOP82_04885 [Variovorax sp.]
MTPRIARWIVAIAAVSWLMGCGTSHLAVLTQHNDGLRTGAYLHERELTPGSVDPATGPGMVRRYSRPVNGNLNGQLLYAPRIDIGGERKDLVIAVTTKNQVSAWDLNEERDPGTARGLVWAHTLPSAPSPPMETAIGINSTPVIDRNRTTLYLVYGISNGLFPINGVGDGGYQVELHLAALDLRTGTVLRDVLISGSVPSAVSPGHVDFVARRQIQRAGLLLIDNPLQSGEQTIYVAFASRWREETHNWHGWVFGYDAASFAPRGVFCSTPDRRADSEGGGIWQGGAGIAADGDGNLYFNTGYPLSSSEFAKLDVYPAY